MDEMTALGWFRSILFGRRYTTKVKLEWNESPEWVRVTDPEIWARSRAAAAGKAIQAAQRGAETGWDRIIVESVEIAS